MRLLTLGGLTLEGSSFNRHKPLLLLAYLALEGPTSRKELADLFFLDTRNPRDSLSTALRYLRNETQGTVTLDGKLVGCTSPCDAAELLESLNEGDLQRGTSLYQGVFLKGLELDLGLELEEWVFSWREFLAGRVREAFLLLGEQAARAGDRGGATRFGERAYGLAGAPELPPEDYGRVYTLLQLGNSPRASVVVEEATSFGIDLAVRRDLIEPAPSREDEQSGVIPHNLPVSGTSFVGRDPERIEIASLLSEPHGRLVTIHGPGGVGKSRLAIQAAQDQLRTNAFPDGVFFVPLDALTKADLIPTSIAASLGISLAGSAEPLGQIKSFLAKKRVLLVLDNYEHLMEAVGLPADLMQACPNLKIIATSREVLNLQEEHVLTLAGLPFPTEDTPLGDAELSEALQLLVQRAKKASLSFALSEDNLQSALKIVRLLDGLPLGIELAAAWVRSLPLEEIAREIEANLEFLEASSRNVTERHQSLRAVFEHSWALLTDREQEVLADLAVFQGGFRREAAREVVGATLPLLASLVDKSLLRVLPTGRYDRHALLHQFTREKLGERNQARDRVLERHARYYLALAKEAEPHLAGERQGQWLARLDEEHENMQAVLESVLENDRVEHGFLRVLGRFWLVRGHIRQGRAWLSRILSHPQLQGCSKVRAVALRTAGNLAEVQGDYAAAQSLYGESLESFGQLGDDIGIARLLADLGNVLERRGDYAAARARYEESLRISRDLGDRQGIAAALLNLGNTNFYLGDYAAARSRYEESLAAYRESGDAYGIAWALSNTGLVEKSQGNYPAARSLYERSLVIRRDLGDKRGIAWSLNELGLVAFHQGDYAAAQPLFEQSLALKRVLGDKRGIGWSLTNMGIVAYHQRDYAAAHSFHEEALNVARELGDESGIATALSNMGNVAERQGDDAAARSLYEQSLDIFRELGDRHRIASSLNNMGSIVQRQGDHAAARSFFEQSLALRRELGDKLGMAECLEALGMIAVTEGDARRAARLWGAAEVLRETLDSPMEPSRRDSVGPMIGVARTMLGADAFLTNWREGRAMSFEHAIGLALSGGAARASRNVEVPE